MSTTTLLADFMEKFGKRLNEQESRLGDEIFMWLQSSLTTERERIATTVLKIALGVLDKSETDGTFDQPHTTQNWMAWKRIRNTIRDKAKLALTQENHAT